MATFNDLLPVWYTHDQHFPSEILAENLWDDAFEYSPFLPHTNENCGFLNHENASHGCDIDVHVPSQHYTEHEDSANVLRDAPHVASYVMTEGREVVWGFPRSSGF